MLRDPLEQAYHDAIGRCLEAMIAMRRFSGQEAIDELKSAIRTIEHGQRVANEKLRRERFANRIQPRAPTSFPESP